MRKAVTSSSTSFKKRNADHNDQLDYHILPSTSTFNLDGKEPEKIMKKAKVFLDEKQKTKARAQSLWSFLDATNAFDQAKFFQEHSEEVFQVIFETCMHQIAKMKIKSDRLSSWNSKELVSLQKTLSLLRKIFLYVPELIRNGWQRQNIALILSYLLDHANHPRLRSLGFRLLLLWMNDQVVEYPEFINLFSNAISLDLFVLDDIHPYDASNTTNFMSPPVPSSMPSTMHLHTPAHLNENEVQGSQKGHTSGLRFVRKLRENHEEKHVHSGLERDGRIKASTNEFHQRIILGGNNPHRAPLLPNPVQPTFNDSIVLIHIFINNLVRLAYVASGSPPPPDEYDYPPGDSFEPDDGIAIGVGIDAATASAKFLFGLFRTHYMTKFVPFISKSLRIQGTFDKDSGFPSCPPSILRSILKFLIGYCLDNNNVQATSHWNSSPYGTPSFSPATPILKSIVLSSHETREMLHEIIRQALVLPSTNTSYRDIIRGAIHVLGVWMLGNEEDRPSFLRSSTPVTRSSSLGSVSTSLHNNSDIPLPISSSPISEENKLLTSEEYPGANSFLRRYLLMIKLIFFQDTKKNATREMRVADLQLVTDWDGLVGLYKDALSVYRALSVSKSGIELEWESWELMLQCVLDIQEEFMNQNEKYSRIPAHSLAEEMADYLWETLLHIFVRAKITHMELWQNLKTHMVQSMRWAQALNQWVRIMQKLTKLLSLRLYKVEYEFCSDTKYRLIEETPSSNRCSAQFSVNTISPTARFSTSGSGRTRVKSRRLSIQGDQQEPVPEGSVSSILKNLSNASLSDITNTFKSERKSTHLPEVVDEEDEEQSSPKLSSRKKLPVSSHPSSVYTTNTSIGKKSTTTSTSTGSEKRGRPKSMHQLDSLFHDSSSKLLNFVHHGETTPQSSKANMIEKDEDKKGNTEWDLQSNNTSMEDMSLKSNRTVSYTILPMGESISIAADSASVNGKLPSGLGSFRSTEFLVLSNVSLDGTQILSIWKNVLLIVGNINEIEGPQNYAVAMNCIVEICDTLRLVRARQPFNDVPIPAMYELAPWLFQAAEMSSESVVGKAAAFGSLCRMMIQKPEETVPEGYYAAFYHAILKGLFYSDNTVIQSIIINSERLFGSSLPGVHILIPAFIDAIEILLLDGDVSHRIFGNVQRSCIKILGSLVSVSNNLKHLTIEACEMVWLTKHPQSKSFSFANVKMRLKSILVKLVNDGPSQSGTEEDNITYCMVLDTLCALSLEEILTSESPQQTLIHECLLSLTNHLYQGNISIVNSVVDCLEAVAEIYKQELDPEKIIIREVLGKIIDALTVHLKLPKEVKYDRGYVVSKLFSCLLGWIMRIEPKIFAETDLCQLVFEVVELGFHVSVDGYDKCLPTQIKSEEYVSSFSFKIPLEKRPSTCEHLIKATSSDLSEKDLEYIKESAEVVLLHLLNQFNNFAPSYGPATMQTTIIGPGISQDEQIYDDYQYFSFNDTTVIALAELSRHTEKEDQARIIIRDLTGRYAWDTKLEPRISISETNFLEKDFSIEKEQCLRHVMKPSEVGKAEQETRQEDPMGSLLKVIGESYPDCLLDPSLPLNVPSELTPLQTEMVGNLGAQLSDYLMNEEQNRLQQAPNIELWYSNLNSLREKVSEKNISNSGEHTIQMQLLTQFSSSKEFVPAIPKEYEHSSVPFQLSRLFMSHMGFITYRHFTNGAFQMLNKTPALYRDLRGLDRKHGRETMKIGLLYVAHGQEDESAILQNDQGSDRYNAFVNSLGWDIDVATHTGYLGGLERNLTNGEKATYYCSSTLEIIFHDVTKMPTDTSDPKQLKKKRHIGNDHVHIVWNEHERDYKFDTIGGDFGNAQIVVTPLPDNLYSIQVYRDSKVPYFGPLVDRMIVSQAILGSLVRSTAIAAFRATLHTNLYSFYKCVYAQRANDVRTISNRHKVAHGNYDVFMKKIFMPEDH